CRVLASRRRRRRRDGNSRGDRRRAAVDRSEEHTSELQSQSNLVCRLLLEKKKLERSQSLYAALEPTARTIELVDTKDTLDFSNWYYNVSDSLPSSLNDLVVACVLSESVVL